MCVCENAVRLLEGRTPLRPHQSEIHHRQSAIDRPFD